MLLCKLTNRHAHSSRGFTLIEMAIVLGIVGILAAGLFRLMSTGSQQTKDQATAQQQLALINAVSGFLASQAGQSWMTTSLGNNGSLTGTLPLPTSNTSVSNCQNNISATFATFCNYLPSSFYYNPATGTGTTNPYGQTYSIQVLRDNFPINTPPVTYSFMIVATPVAGVASSVIPDVDGGRISSLIGGDGGFIYSSTLTCNATAPSACGTMGAWVVNANTQYGFSTTVAIAGSVASRTFIPAAANSTNQWLARIPIPGDTNFTDNMMATNYYTAIPATGTNDLFMYPYANQSGSNNIHIYKGALKIEGSNANGSIQLNSGTISLGNLTSEIVGGGAGAAAYVSIVAPSVSIPTKVVYYGGNAANGSNGLIYLSTAGCTQQNLANSLAIGCPYTGSGANQTIIPAINILSGDINLTNGQVEALKILSASDARLKMNIRPIEDPLANLMKIDAISFAFKKGGTESMGVTAQNLEKVYPQLVSETNGTKYVEYNGLIGPLIGAVQELKRQNDDLRDQLQQQKLREDRLENRINKKPAIP